MKAICSAILSGSLFLASSAGWAGDFQVGYSKLLMSNDETGHQVWYQYHEQSGRQWSAAARADLLNRFGLSEGKLSPTVSYQWGGVNTITGEVGLAPGARIFPQASGSLEYARPIAQGLVINFASGYARYSGSQNLSVTGGVEVYLPDNWVLVGRLSVARETVDLASGDAYHPSGSLKALHYFNDDDRAWIQVGRGAEGADTGPARSPGSVSTYGWGVGGTKYFRPGQATGLWGVEAALDWQERESSLSRMVTVTLALNHRW